MAQSFDLTPIQSSQHEGTVETDVQYQREMRFNPWVITCDRWSQLGQYIVLPINPGDISWHVPIKAAVEQTKHATVSYVWRNSILNISSEGGKSSINSMLQDFEVAISFNSANIAPMVSAKARSKWGTGDAWNYAIDPDGKADDLEDMRHYSAMGNDTLRARGDIPDSVGYVQDYDAKVPLGVQNLYRFLALMDEPRITYLENGTIRSNRVNIVMNTPVFPQMVLSGHITPGGVSWEEGADHPNSFDVSFSLTVTDTWPKIGLGSLSSLLTTYKHNIEDNRNTRDVLYAFEQNGRVGVDKGNKAKENIQVQGSNTASSVPSQTAGDDDPNTDTLADTMIEIDRAAALAAADQVGSVETGSSTDVQAAIDAVANEVATGIAAEKAVQKAWIEQIVDNQFGNASPAAKAAISNMTQAQIDKLAANATKNGSIEDKTAARNIANNSELTTLEKVSLLRRQQEWTGVQQKIKKQQASRIPGASRKGSRSA